MSRLRLVVATALVLGGLVGCGGGGGGSAALDNACDLLTNDEVEDLLGVPTSGSAEDTDRSSGTYCQWESKDSGPNDGDAGDDDEGPAPYFISVEDERGEDAVQGFESGRRGADDEDLVDDLGSDAYFSDPHGLNVRNGDRVFSTYVGGNDQHPLSNRETKEIERRAADIIIERLGEPENEEIVDDAAECARTGRCAGTRYRACGVLKDAEVARLTGFDIRDVEGTARPAGSTKAGFCQYQLDVPDDDSGSRQFARVEVQVEPDGEKARDEYRRFLEDVTGGEEPLDTEEIPNLGEDAFYTEVFDVVYVLENDHLLSVSYDTEDVDLDPSEVKDTVIAIAKLAAARV